MYCYGWHLSGNAVSTPIFPSTSVHAHLHSSGFGWRHALITSQDVKLIIRSISDAKWRRVGGQSVRKSNYSKRAKVSFSLTPTVRVYFMIFFCKTQIAECICSSLPFFIHWKSRQHFVLNLKLVNHFWITDVILLFYRFILSEHLPNVYIHMSVTHTHNTVYDFIQNQII